MEATLLLSIAQCMLSSVLFAIFAIVFSRLNSRKNRFCPDAVIFDGLLAIVYKLEQGPKDWLDLSFRRKLLSTLEETAACVEKDMPRQLRSGDMVTDLWFSQKALEVAAAMRDKKRWILTPKSDTREQLITHLAASLTHVASGDWDSLERATPEQLTRPEQLRAIAITIARVIITGLAPLLVLFILQQTPLAFQGDIFEYVKVGALIWLVISLLAALDPTYTVKIATLKDIADYLPLPGRRKE